MITPTSPSPNVTWVASTNGSGQIQREGVVVHHHLSNTGNVTVVMKLSATAQPPNANVTKTYSFTISPPPVIG